MRKCPEFPLETEKRRGNPGGVRKDLRTLRKVVLRSAQTLRSMPWHNLHWIGSLFLFGFASGIVAQSSFHLEFVLSQDRVFILNRESQQWQFGRLGQPPSDWVKIPPPPGMFRALHLFVGPAGGAYLQDAILPRLCLFDTAGQWVSCHDIPEPFAQKRPDRVVITPRRDGRFVFIDRDNGEASVWREASPGERSSQWEIGASTKVPSGISQCLEFPWYRSLCCFAPKKRQCYDGFLNRQTDPLDSSLILHSEVQVVLGKSDEPLGYQVKDPKTPTKTWCFDTHTGFAPCP